MELNEKVAIVTGSGRGIGRAIAEELARYGASVVVSDLDGDAVAQVAAEIGADHPDVTVDSIALNVTDDESVANMTDQVIDRFGRVDILVNNAGIIGAPGWGAARGTCRDRLGPDLRGQREGHRQGFRLGRRGDEDQELRQDRQHRLSRRTAGQPAQHALPRVEIRCHQSHPGLRAGPCPVQHKRERHLPPACCGRPCGSVSPPEPINLNDSMEGTTPREAFEQFVARSIPLGP